jgi:hypothetical protein
MLTRSPLWAFALPLLGLALVVLPTGCTKMEERLLSDDEPTRAAALEKLKSSSESSRQELVPILIANLDAGRSVSPATTKEDLGPSLVAQAQSTLRAATVRERALAGLAAIGAPSVPALDEVLADRTQRPWVRADVARTLGEIGEPAQRAAPTLERVFGEAKDERVKAHTAAALVLLGRKDAQFRDALVRCQTHCDDKQKAYATQVLAKASP